MPSPNLTSSSPRFGLLSPFRPRSARRRGPRGTLSKGRGLSAWETLGHSVTGLEHLESRALMAADVAVAFAQQTAEVAFFTAPSQQVYKVDFTNVGDASASSVTAGLSFGGAVPTQTWTVAYSGGASGTFSGSGPFSQSLSLPAGGKATVTVTARMAADATGPLVATATASAVGDANTANNSATSSRRLTGQFLALSDALGPNATGVVRIVSPATGAVVSSFTPYSTPINGGLSVVVGNFDGTGRPMVAVAPRRGMDGTVRFFAQSDSGAWQERVDYRTQPFAGSRDGLRIAAGDVDANGTDDIAVAPASGNGPLKIFLTQPRSSGAADPVANQPFRTVNGLRGSGGGFALADMGTFANGVAVDAAKQDAKAELILGSGGGVGPRVQVHDLSTAAAKVIDTIAPFSPNSRDPIAVHTARITPDSIPELILDIGGTRPRTEIYNGLVGSAANPKLSAFAAFGNSGRAADPGTTVGIDTSGDGIADSLLGSQGYRGAAGLKLLSTAGVAQGTRGSFTEPTGMAAAIARTNPDIVRSGTGLESISLVSGPASGTAATNGKKLQVHYIGTLLDGTKFDSSRDRGTPFEFTLGQGQVIKGWDEGLLGRKPGDRLQLIIPPALGYGSQSQGSIPANSTLCFDIEVISVT